MGANIGLKNNYLFSLSPILPAPHLQQYGKLTAADRGILATVWKSIYIFLLKNGGFALLYVCLLKDSSKSHYQLVFYLFNNVTLTYVHNNLLSNNVITSHHFTYKHE